VLVHAGESAKQGATKNPAHAASGTELVEDGFEGGHGGETFWLATSVDESPQQRTHASAGRKGAGASDHAWRQPGKRKGGR